MTQVTRPWYCEPWPWLLMSGPAIVVVAGLVTAVLAVTSFDGFVVDPREKKGLVMDKAMPDAGAKRRIMEAEPPGD